MLSGDAGGADDIADTPATLVTFLHLLLHNFSMNSCATLDYWLGVLEKEIRDMVVSKHSAHITEIDKLLRGEWGTSLCCGIGCGARFLPFLR